jgi:hypothetical protein
VGAWVGGRFWIGTTPLFSTNVRVCTAVNGIVAVGRQARALGFAFQVHFTNPPTTSCEGKQGIGRTAYRTYRELF